MLAHDMWLFHVASSCSLITHAPFTCSMTLSRPQHRTHPAQAPLHYSSVQVVDPVSKHPVSTTFRYGSGGVGKSRDRGVI